MKDINFSQTDVSILLPFIFSWNALNEISYVWSKKCWKIVVFVLKNVLKRWEAKYYGACPGPLAPYARIIPLDQQAPAIYCSVSFLSFWNPIIEQFLSSLD